MLLASESPPRAFPPRNQAIPDPPSTPRRRPTARTRLLDRLLNLLSFALPLLLYNSTVQRTGAAWGIMQQTISHLARNARCSYCTARAGPMPQTHLPPPPGLEAPTSPSPLLSRGRQMFGCSVWPCISHRRSSRRNGMSTKAAGAPRKKNHSNLFSNLYI